jgi:hypothetical protein
MSMSIQHSWRRAISMWLTMALVLGLLAGCGRGPESSTAAVDALESSGAETTAVRESSGSPPAAANDSAGVAVYDSVPIPRTDFVKYEDEEYPFEVWLPREWYIGQLSGPDYGMMVLSDNDPNKPRAGIMILVEPVATDADLSSAIRTAEETLRAQSDIADFSVDLTRPASVNGAPAEERTYSYLLHGQKARQRTLFIRGAEQIYAISLIAPRELYAQHESLFNDVIVSFKGA